MFGLFENELNNLDSVLDEVKRAGIDFLENIGDKPTYIADQSAASIDLAEEGYGALASLEIFRRQYEKLMVASAGPRYWGFVTGGATPAAIAGDWLTAIYDQNTQSTQGVGDVSAILEKETLRLLCQLLHLPEHFNGGFVTGATMSNFTGLAVARQWAGELSGRDVSREGVSGDLVVMAATPHSSVIKSLAMLGIGSNNMLRIRTLDGREAMDLADFERQLIDHQGRPVVVNCSAGTVNTVDFDDISAIVALKRKYPFWLHIDAAFGGFAACLPSQRHLLDGWEEADSITIDCHKWMNVPYDSAVSLVRKRHSRLQVSSFQNSNAPYLGDPAENFSYLNFLPENSRRFRALPAWFSLTAYGRSGFEWIVQNSIDCASELGDYIQSSEHFELSAPVRLNVVCFRLKSGLAGMSAFLDKLNRRGKVFMTPTSLSGQPAIRAAFVNYRTEKQDVLVAIREMEEVVRTL
ncbi:MAG: aspartate aminotransferase family protein [Dyadobacter sp. 50-39]|uniref:pyridoxal phosphate-dependent decarboxylase family protein n=1 Tax=Dyadobacter sp. 50-39 TaxID=1895756 RepID=UPI000968F800|nr:pyridoxal-dependent decarboxylase [Dyadobacter sp. 50-39]OJV14474.1 MAG: aspartate aminotransferase family protein [Dyadobacter sp. 50-39]